MTLIPRSSAAWIVRTDSSSSLPPHWKPPIAQVPSPTRLAAIGRSRSFVVSTLVFMIRSGASSEPSVMELGTDEVHRRARREPGQHADHFGRGDLAHQADRFVGVVRGM